MDAGHVALEKWLAARKWTQRQLALRLHVNEARVSRLVSGDVKPTLQQAVELERFTGIAPRRWVA
jgi:plasmid maintenance system antidote protein VapI